MTDIPNELVETGALAIQRVTSFGHYEATDAAAAALLAVGLPALLERVEAADSSEQSQLILTKGLIAERDALAAKVARVEALIEFAESELAKGYFITGRVATDDLRTALDEEGEPK